MDKIAQAFLTMRWVYGDGDPDALAIMKGKIASAGRHRTLITYKELLDGVLFRLANVAGGEPFHIDLSEGRELDRRILGSFLGRMCSDSYRAGGFMASALAVTEVERKPGKGFGRLMHQLGAISNLRPRTVDDFWIQEVTKAHDWFAENANRVI